MGINFSNQKVPLVQTIMLASSNIPVIPYHHKHKTLLSIIIIVRFVMDAVHVLNLTLDTSCHCYVK